MHPLRMCLDQGFVKGLSKINGSDTATKEFSLVSTLPFLFFSSTNRWSRHSLNISQHQFFVVYPFPYWLILWKQQKVLYPLYVSPLVRDLCSFSFISSPKFGSCNADCQWLYRVSRWIMLKKSWSTLDI